MPNTRPKGEYLAEMQARRERIEAMKTTHTRIMARIKIGVDEVYDDAVNVFVMIPNEDLNNDLSIRTIVHDAMRRAIDKAMTTTGEMDVSYSTQTTRVI